MSATTVLRYINNKKFLFTAVALFFLPFIIFCFWNFPSAGDYMILDKRAKYSFWELQNQVYHTWSGRYFVTLMSGMFSYSGFLYSHYYLHSLLLLLFTVLSWMFCLMQINTYLLSRHLCISSLALLSLLLLALEIHVIPEPVTAFYWFSSALTYQLPLILIVLLTGVLIRLSFYAFQSKFYFAIACLLIVLLNGCNEFITLFFLVISTALLTYYFYVYKKLPAAVLMLYAVNIISTSFLFFAPGILYRGSLINSRSVISIICIAAIKFIVLNWYFLKEPLWWFAVFFTSLFVIKNNNLLPQFRSISLITLPVFYILSGLLIYMPILYVANGSLPLRTENIICFLYSLMLLLILAICISNTTNNVFASGIILYKYRYLLFSILIFSASIMKPVADTLLSGFFYKQVMKERLSLFEEAKRNNIHEVTFDDYETAVDKQIKEHPVFERRVLRNIILKQPPIICFENDLYDLNYMKEIYGIKKINLNKK